MDEQRQPKSKWRKKLAALVTLAVVGLISWLALTGRISLAASLISAGVWLGLAAVIYFRTHFIEKECKSFKGFLGFLILAFIAASPPTIRDIWSPSSDEPEFSIVLIGESQSPATQAHWKSFMDGFELVMNDQKHGTRRNNPNDKTTIGELWVTEPRDTKRITVNVEFVPVPQDGTKKQNEEALADRIAELALNKKVLMLVGFVTSTRAQIALKTLDATKSEDWPAVILPMATVSKLVQEHNLKKDRPILRIVPPNLSQADPIARQILKAKDGKPDVSLAIFRDRQNSDYSADLAGELRKSVEENGVAVVFDGSVGPDGSGSYVTDSFLMLRPDYIVFLGMLDTGVPLVRQIRAMKPLSKPFADEPWNPTILLSDGSVEKAIEDYARKDALKGIYGFFPHGKPLRFPASLPEKSAFESPSFTMFGYDTALFAHDVLQTAKDSKSKLCRKSVAEAVAAVRDSWNHKSARTKNDVVVGNYSFNDYNDAEGMSFHVWQFDGSKWILLESESNK